MTRADSVTKASTSRIEQEYRDRTARSREAFAEANAVMPGGVARQAGYWAPYPITLARAEGSRAWDIDGNAYIDMFNNFASLAHGHAYAPVVAAAQARIASGSAWAANNLDQNALARLICARVPSAQSVRFTNSGAEAVALALLIARAATGRRLILMARYGYHG